MGIPRTTQRRADAISLGVMLIGFGALTYLNNWWPGVLIVVGVALLLRQYMRGRYYDMALTTVIFGGSFLTFALNVNLQALMPVLFTLGGIYLIFREYFVTKERVGDEKIVDKRRELEDADEDE